MHLVARDRQRFDRLVELLLHRRLVLDELVQPVEQRLLLVLFLLLGFTVFSEYELKFFPLLKSNDLRVSLKISRVLIC